MNRKALATLSGGLDSILAVEIILEQGIEVEAINFLTIFCTCTNKGCQHAATKAAEALKIPLKVVNISEEYIDIIKNPKHGYGSNMNPCIDCRIFIFKKAKEYMKEIGASFIVTGEVLGERPMSQRRDAILLIEREAGLKGLILRPLSAKLFEPTLAEKEGIVDRNRLLSIHGRCRKPQIELAKHFNLKDYPCPAGGCLLTDPGFSRRVKDLMKHGLMNLDELRLIKLGRHYRISDGSKLVVSRNEIEAGQLEAHIKPTDICFEPKEVPGPLSILRGNITPENINIAAKIVAYHTKFRDKESLNIEYRTKGHGEGQVISVAPAAQDLIEKIRL